MNEAGGSVRGSGFERPSRGDLRWSFLPLAIGWAIVAALFSLSFDEARWQAWSDWMWWPYWPPFCDLEVVRLAAAAWTHGIDPLPAAAGFAFPYPRLWLWTGYLGLNSIPVAFEGLMLDCSWVACVVWICRVRSARLAVALSAVFLSPPVRLTLERANVDLVIFLLAVLMVWTGLRVRAWWLAPAVAALATLLKIYPAGLLCAGALLAPRGQRPWWLLAGSLVAIAWALNVDELRLISTRAPTSGAAAAFGCDILPRLVVRHFLAGGTEAYARAASLGAKALFALATIAVAARSWRFRWVQRPELGTREVALFAMAATVCCGAFALGFNFAYRMIFVLPALPLLWGLACEGLARTALEKRWATVVLVAVAVSLFCPFGVMSGALALKQIADWVLAVGLAAGFAVVVFTRIRET